MMVGREPCCEGPDPGETTAGARGALDGPSRAVDLHRARPTFGRASQLEAALEASLERRGRPKAGDALTLPCPRLSLSLPPYLPLRARDLHLMDPPPHPLTTLAHARRRSKSMGTDRSRRGLALALASSASRRRPGNEGCKGDLCQPSPLPPRSASEAKDPHRPSPIAALRWLPPPSCLALASRSKRRDALLLCSSCACTRPRPRSRSKKTTDEPWSAPTCSRADPAGPLTRPQRLLLPS